MSQGGAFKPQGMPQQFNVPGVGQVRPQMPMGPGPTPQQGSFGSSINQLQGQLAPGAQALTQPNNLGLPAQPTQPLPQGGNKGGAQASAMPQMPGPSAVHPGLGVSPMAPQGSSKGGQSAPMQMASAGPKGKGG